MSAAARRAAVLRANARAWTKIDSRQLPSLLASGLTDAQIASLFGVRRSAVGHARRRAALPLNRAPRVVGGNNMRAYWDRKNAQAAADAAALSLPLPPNETLSPLELRVVVELSSGPLTRAQIASHLSLGEHGKLVRVLPRLRKLDVLAREYRNPPPGAHKGQGLATWLVSPAITSLFSRTTLTPLQQRIAATPRAVSAAEHHIAKYASRLPHLADDIRSAAYGALADAARLFDPSRVQFHTYAPRRIQGAIQDALRDSMPLGYRRHADAISVRTGSYGDAISPLDSLAAPASPLESLDSFAALIGKLGPQSREVLHLMFVHGLSAAEVGARLGLSTSRVFQIRQAALARLAASITPTP